MNTTASAPPSVVEGAPQPTPPRCAPPFQKRPRHAHLPLAVYAAEPGVARAQDDEVGAASCSAMRSSTSSAGSSSRPLGVAPAPRGRRRGARPRRRPGRRGEGGPRRPTPVAPSLCVLLRAHQRLPVPQQSAIAPASRSAPGSGDFLCFRAPERPMGMSAKGEFTRLRALVRGAALLVRGGQPRDEEARPRSTARRISRAYLNAYLTLLSAAYAQ